MFAIISLFVIVALSLIITRIAAMALMATGLSRDAARFQARSAFTGSGFTTRESESVVNHPVQNGYAVGELNIESGDWLAGKTLSETALSKEGVLVLGIQSQDSYIGAPRADDRIQAGDVLILYASAARIAELDQRTAGTGGERAHQEAVLEQQSRRGETNRTSLPSGIGGLWRHILHPFRDRHSSGTAPLDEISKQAKQETFR